MNNDPISDLLTRIRNAALAGKKRVSIPHSKLKEGVVKLLEEKGYVTNVSSSGKKEKKDLSFDIVYDDADEPKIKSLEKVSKLSRRQYVGYKKIRPVKFGHGHLVLSTPKGIMTDEEARKEKVGGEALFKIW